LFWITMGGNVMKMYERTLGLHCWRQSDHLPARSLCCPARRLCLLSFSSRSAL
jgi:hypothetical protein